MINKYIKSINTIRKSIRTIRRLASSNIYIIAINEKKANRLRKSKD